MASETAKAKGFTLIEVVLALFILAVGVIATAPLFIYAVKENAVSGDLGAVGDQAVRRMELLRATIYPNLTNGGDLESNVTGYFDDTNSGFVVRWTIANNPNPPASTKTIAVRAVADRQVIGRAEQVTMFGIRGE